MNWCAENFTRLSSSGPWTYRTALRCAQWLLVVSLAQLHLDDDVEENRDALLWQLGGYQRLARAIERQCDHVLIERLIVLRSSLDCWKPVGELAEMLLSAARATVAVLMLIEAYPLVELWDLPCVDAWALVQFARDRLAEINDHDGALRFADYAIEPDEMVIAKFTWQRAQGIARHVGIRLSEN